MSLRPALTGLLLTGALLTAAGCGTSGPDTSDGGTSASTSPQSSPTSPDSPSTAPATPRPTSTLSPAQQQAFGHAVDAVMAYRQIGVDLYSGARTDISDLDAVTTGQFRTKSENAVASSLAKGSRITPKGAQLTLVSAEPVKINLTREVPTVVVRVCIDGTAATAIDGKGNESPGGREELQYTVVYTTYWPNPVWALSDAKGEPDPKDRAC